MSFINKHNKRLPYKTYKEQERVSTSEVNPSTHAHTHPSHAACDRLTPQLNNDTATSTAS